jgi:hypothetical protein
MFRRKVPSTAVRPHALPAVLAIALAGCAVDAADAPTFSSELEPTAYALTDETAEEGTIKAPPAQDGELPGESKGDGCTGTKRISARISPSLWIATHNYDPPDLYSRPQWLFLTHFNIHGELTKILNTSCRTLCASRSTSALSCGGSLTPVPPYTFQPSTLPINSETLQQDDTYFEGFGDCACAPASSDIGDDKPSPSPPTQTN